MLVLLVGSSSKNLYQNPKKVLFGKEQHQNWHLTALDAFTSIRIPSK